TRRRRDGVKVAPSKQHCEEIVQMTAQNGHSSLHCHCTHVIAFSCPRHADKIYDLLINFNKNNILKSLIKPLFKQSKREMRVPLDCSQTCPASSRPSEKANFKLHFNCFSPSVSPTHAQARHLPVVHLIRILGKIIGFAAEQ